MDYIIFLLPAMLLSFYAQFKVQSTFSRYSKLMSASGITADRVAAELLREAGVTDVSVQRVRGSLTDHYDPSSKVIRLSDAVYGSSSIAAIGVAAHETGHACQHFDGYVPLNFRSAFVPVANIGSKLSMPLIILGLMLGAGGNFLVTLGIILFSAAVLFQIITLPVEFNASSRALEMVESAGVLSRTETDSARSVLNAAALTYVAAAAVAIANLLRLIMISRSNNRR